MSSLELTSQSIGGTVICSLRDDERFPTGHAIYSTDPINGGKKLEGVSTHSKEVTRRLAARLQQRAAGITGREFYVEWRPESRS